MPVWPFLSAYATGLIFLSRRAGDRLAVECLMYVMVGLVIMQVWKPAGLGDLIWLASSATWAVVAGAVARAMIKADADWRQTVTVSVSLIGVSLCYCWGRFAGAAFGPGAHLLAADVFGVLAWTAIGGRGLGGFIRDIARIMALGGGRVRRVYHARVSGVACAQEEK